MERWEDRDQAAAPVVPSRAGGCRIAWVGVLAGVVTTLAVQLLLSLLGIMLGPLGSAGAAGPATGLDWRTGLWVTGSAVASLFLGGLIAAWVSHVQDRPTGVVHGLLSWGLATVVTAAVVTTAAGGRLVGGVVGRTVAALAPLSRPATLFARQGVQALEDSGLDPKSLERQAEELLRPPEPPARSETGAPGARGDDDQAAAKGPTTSSQKAQQEIIGSLTDALFRRGGRPLAPGDRQLFVERLVTRGGLRRADAEQTVNEWERTVHDSLTRFDEAQAQAAKRARESSTRLVQGAAQAAGWATAGLVLGAIAAAFGGSLGRRRTPAVG